MDIKKLMEQVNKEKNERLLWLGKEVSKFLDEHKIDFLEGDRKAFKEKAKTVLDAVAKAIKDLKPTAQTATTAQPKPASTTNTNPTGTTGTGR